ncbi:MAG: hypothetical protein JWP75_1104, partial [Frondihabitans sp.]|nr:hypothetical protein [Frondihabitans sp.]
MTTIDLDDRVLSRGDGVVPTTSRWAAVTTIVVLAFLTVWGIYTCYANLGGANFQADEPTYLGAGLNYVHGIFVENREHPPLAKYFIGEAQIIGSTGKVSGRFITTTFVFVTGWVILFWLRREIGLVWAVTATGAWWLLPRAAAEAGIRIDRFAILEPFMVAFAIASLAVAWWWYRRGSWWLPAVSGILMAASVTSKVSTAVLVLSFVYLAFRRKQLWRGLISMFVYAMAFIATFILIYLPAGFMSSIEYMIQFQTNQRDGAAGDRS